MSAAFAVGRLRKVLIGRAQPFARLGTRSAIDKCAVGHAAAVERLGLTGDEQGDRSVHGGPDKAVHLYAWSHYAAWQQELPGVCVLDDAGAFGENFSVEGLDESSVCIGDRWRVGGVVLEVSQGRQPCWKLNHRFGVDDMAARVQQSLRTGWYCRVSQAGTVVAGDEMLIVDRPHPDWSIAQLLALIRDRNCDRTVLAEVLALPLTPSWRKLFARRMELGCAESWIGRMRG
jgi:MOSC domain-containing protein YiiM